MAVVFSPSNLGTFRDCPRRFYGQSVTRELAWKGSKQKSRGTRLHSFLQGAVRNGWPGEGLADPDVDASYAKGVVEALRAAGDPVFIEHEMAMTAKGNPCDWWAGDAFLRARADVFLLPKDCAKPVLIGDIKTGRMWDNDAFQLRVECLLAHIIYQRPVVKYQYWYIDQGETEEGVIDFRNGLSPVQDIYDLLRDAVRAVRDNDYPATPNKFCRWCGWHKQKECGVCPMTM